MTIFSRLFGKKPATAAQEKPAVLEAPLVDRALFVEEPQPQLEPKVPRTEITVLAALLERDYEDMGQKHGYEYHDLDRMEFQMELIAADYRKAYDKELEETEHQLSEIEPYLVEKTREKAPDLYTKLETKHKSLTRKQRDMRLQKDLAMTGEGYIESAVKYYKAGFLAGMELYLKRELLFKHVKIM